MDDIKFIDARDSHGRTLADTPTIQELVRMECQNGSIKLNKYTEETGFHAISNPGWIKFEMDDLHKVSYIRFLLWDSCGNGKKQPSHRKYQYRLLYSEDKISFEGTRWTVLYDTMQNGSNGWQEFYLENRPLDIRSIKIHCCNNTRNSETQLIKVQAFRYPTRELAQEFGLTVPDEAYAPSIHGIINNRIICGDLEEAGISKSIYKEVSTKLKQLAEKIGESDEEIENFRQETQEKLGELNLIDNDISKFQASLLEPVEEAIRKQKRQDKKWRKINIAVMLLAIATILIDILRLIF